MSDAEKQSTADKKGSVDVNAVLVNTQHSHRSPDGNDVGSLRRADNVLLAKLGYKSEFRREFSVRLQNYEFSPCPHAHTPPCSALRRSPSLSLSWE